MVSHTTRLACYAIPRCPGPSHPDTKVRCTGDTIFAPVALDNAVARKAADEEMEAEQEARHWDSAEFGASSSDRKIKKGNHVMSEIRADESFATSQRHPERASGGSTNTEIILYFVLSRI